MRREQSYHISEIQTLSSQEKYDYITTHSPEYAEPSNIGEGSNNLNVFTFSVTCYLKLMPSESKGMLLWT
jgi:hypothetical protein